MTLRISLHNHAVERLDCARPNLQVLGVRGVACATRTMTSVRSRALSGATPRSGPDCLPLPSLSSKMVPVLLGPLILFRCSPNPFDANGQDLGLVVGRTPWSTTYLSDASVFISFTGATAHRGYITFFSTDCSGQAYAVFSSGSIQDALVVPGVNRFFKVTETGDPGGTMQSELQAQRAHGRVDHCNLRPDRRSVLRTVRHLATRLDRKSVV